MTDKLTTFQGAIDAYWSDVRRSQERFLRAGAPYQVSGHRAFDSATLCGSDIVEAINAWLKASHFEYDPKTMQWRAFHGNVKARVKFDINYIAMNGIAFGPAGAEIAPVVKSFGYKMTWWIGDNL